MNTPRHTLRSLAALAAISCTAVLVSADQTKASDQRTQPTTQEPVARANDVQVKRDLDGKLSHRDRNFIEEAAKGGMKEVQISQAVLAKLTVPAAKDFANMMVNDHMAANAELTALASQKGVTLPEAKERVIKKWSDNDHNVDHDYIEQMEEDHEETIKLFEKGAKSEDPDIAAFAQKTLPKLRQHLSLLQSQTKPAVKQAK
jgi:putative membrane protein